MAVGPQLTNDGNTPPSGRQGKTGEATVSQAHGKYYEAASRAVLFTAGDQGIGAAAASLTIGTTALLSLYNPTGSGKRLSIKRVRIGYFSGTLGAGAFYHALSAPAGFAVAPSGTAAASNCTDAGNQSGVAAVGVCKITATVVAPGSAVLGPICSLGAALASTALGLTYANEDVDGEIVVEPGNYYHIQGVTAAGSTPKVSVAVTWEEVPIVNSQG